MPKSEDSPLGAARFVVIETLTPKTGRESELRAELEAVAAAEFAAAQPHGVLRFDLLTEERGPRLMLHERWRSRKHFDDFHAHFRPPELIAFIARSDELLADPLTVAVGYWLPQDDHG